MSIKDVDIYNLANKNKETKSSDANEKKPIKVETKKTVNKTKGEITASETESSSASTQSESKNVANNLQSASTFKIKKGSRNARRTTVTYRLNTETIDGIEEIASVARKSINETVQELLDWALENVEVE